MSAALGEGQVDGCLFCRIANGQDTNTKLLYQDDEFAAFHDIHPAAPHHYLIVPRVHLPNVNSLKREHAPFLDKLVSLGRQVLREQHCDSDEVRMGFHRPPFTTVSHLHLHVIAPVASMSFIGRMIFRPDSWWFIMVETVKAKLDSPVS